MNEELEKKLLEENPPYEIEKLDKKTILNKEIFEYILSIQEPADKEKIILDLEEKADNLKILPNFKRTLKSYEKKYKDNNSLTNLTKQTHDEIANTLLQNNNIYVFENDICIYENGVYRKNEKNVFRKVIELVPDATIRFRNEVYQYLLLTTKEKEIDRESGIINFKNGLYSIKNRKLYEHTPKFFSINQINTNLNLQAPKVQAIDDVLNKLSNNISERKQTILEMIGYSMTTSTKLQKAFILYGPTARNGKSTLLNLIRELIGRENVGEVSFEDLNTKQFAGVGIKGKILNIGDEMTDEYVKDVSRFKMWVTGDDLEVEEKFKPRQKIKPYAKFIFNANKLPKVADKTDGFYRRLQLIPLEYSFTDKDARKFNFNELTTKEALEYLAKISLEAYLNIGENFANNKESQNEINNYKSVNNNVLSFLEDKDYIRTFIEANTTTKKAIEVYSYYQKFCKENGDVAIGRNAFYKEIEQSKHVFKGKYQGWTTYTFDKNYYTVKT